LNIQEQQCRVYLSTSSTNTITKNKILTHAKADQLDKAHQLIGRLTTECDTFKAYNQIIKAYSKQRCDPTYQRKASELLEEMKRNGHAPTSQTYIQLLLGRASSSKSDLLPWFYEFLRLEELRKYRRTCHKFKTIVRAMASQGHPQLLHMLKYADQHCFELDKQTYTTAIIGCALNEANLGMAEEVLDYARQKGKAEVEAYDVLIRGYLVKRQDLKSASHIFSTMSKNGLDASMSIYASFIKAYIDEPMADKNASLRIETVRRLWQGMLINHEKELPDISLIAQMLRYYRRHGALSDAEQLYLDTTKRMHIKLDRVALEEMRDLLLAFLKRKQINSVLSLHYDLLALGYYKPSLNDMQEIIRQLRERGETETAQQLIQITTESLDQHIPSSSLYLQEAFKQDDNNDNNKSVK
jgi:hypothetical protein